MQSETSFTMPELVKSSFLSDRDVALFRNLIRNTPQNSSSEVQSMLSYLEAAVDGVHPESASTVSSSHETTTQPAEEPTNTVSSQEPIMENIPEARPTKAVGVQFLREQLAALQDPVKAATMDPYELQYALEQQGYEVAMQRLEYMKKESLERGDTLQAMNLTPLKKTMWDWHQKTVPLIIEEIQRCDEVKGRASHDRKTYGPFLKLLKPETLSMITMLELLRLHNSSGIADGMKTARAVIDVGKAVEMEYNAMQIKKASSKRLIKNQEVHSLFASGKLFNMAVRRAHVDMMKQQQMGINELIESSEGDTGTTAETGEWTPVWPSTIRAKVGSVLTSIFLDAAKIPVPSFNPETGEKM